MAKTKKGGTSAPVQLKGAITKTSNALKIALYVIIAIAILYAGVMLANLPALQSPISDGNAPAIGTLTVYTPWTAGKTFGEKAIGFVGLLLGYGSDGGQQVNMGVFIVSLAIFLIILVSLGDIFAMSSTFSPLVSWLIALGLAIISGVSGIVKSLTVIFGITSGIGAIGISIILLSSIFAVVLVNLGIGGTLRKWRMMRQIEIEEMKSEKGTQKVADAIFNLKRTSEAFSDGEKI